MSTDVDICNIALSHLGDTASVASINPPETSAQAQYCARFYPIARDSILEMHDWSFITRRDPLALLAVTNAQWDYVYAVPDLFLGAIAVIPPDAQDDCSASVNTTYPSGYPGEVLNSAVAYSPQPFCIETLSTGDLVVCTNQEDAVLRYTVSITDSAKFPALVVLTLSWLLASMLAGPLLKGDVGIAEGKRCYEMFQAHIIPALNNDSDDRLTRVNHVVPWMVGR